MISRLLQVSTMACVLAPMSFAQVQAYLVDSTNRELYSVDLVTGAANLIASTNNNGLTSPADLTWIAGTDQLWTIDLSGGEVGTIDTFTGIFTAHFFTGLHGWQAMAWDPGTQKFYLANQDDNNYVLDPVTGVTTLLGNSGFSLISCLDVDASGTLWGVDFSSSSIVMVDKVTGVGTKVAKVPAGFQGLGIDQTNGTWYATNRNDDSLYTIDPVTGTATWIGAHGAGVTFPTGFDLVDDPCTTAYGKGCPGAGGFVPELSMIGCPKPGGQVTLNINQGLGGAISALLISPGQASIPVGGGCSLLVQSTPLSLLIPLGGSGPGNGSASLPAVIPLTVPSGTIYLQLFVSDAAGPIFLSASNGLKLNI